MAARKAVVHLPNSPPDATVDVPGLGLFVNGQEKEVNDEQIQIYEAAGFTFPEESEGTLALPFPTRPVDKDINSRKRLKAEKEAKDKEERTGANAPVVAPVPQRDTPPVEEPTDRPGGGE